jgi:hypothetical protein
MFFSLVPNISSGGAGPSYYRGARPPLRACKLHLLAGIAIQPEHDDGHPLQRRTAQLRTAFDAA